MVQTVEFAVAWIADEKTIQELLRRASRSKLLDDESDFFQLAQSGSPFHKNDY
jgi:hypothetical protein